MYSRFRYVRTVLLSTLLLLVASGIPVLLASAQGEEVRRTQIQLLEPISGGEMLNVEPGIGTWLAYFESAYAWIYEVAVGICIIWMLIGGIQVMTSSDQADKRQSGITKMKASITGLIVFIFAGPILRFLNDMFFT
ncbi:MAG: hypothetical protein PHU04_04350 [Candidatus Peribacteraceae bacterium]|nr:hypothetical protein [Candidatus Peribacteraceae bacterium]